MARRRKAARERKQPSFVQVLWLDAVNHSGWAEGPDAAKYQPEECLSRGWLVDENDERVLLASTISGDDVAQVMVIPRGMIKKMEVLDVK